MRKSPPLGLLLGLTTGLLLFALTTLPIRDVDLFWHLRAGAEILAGTSVGSIGTDWTFAPDPLPWVTTQWLSEVLLQTLYDIGGWPALVVMRTITAAIAVAILGWGTLRGRPTLLAGLPFLFAAASTISVSQERPNQATLIGAAVLGPVLLRGLSAGHLPRWWLAGLGTWTWANFHGGWVLAPGILFLVGLGRLLDHGLRDRVARHAFLLSAACLGVGSLTPAGLSSTGAALRFTSATSVIQEWAPTIPLEGPGLITVGMLMLILVAWARSLVPRSEALATVLIVCFSWVAIRNIPPAMLLLSPLVASRLCLAFPKVGQDPEPRWSAPLGISLATALTVAGLLGVAGRDHLPAEFPVGLARSVSELPGTQRVLNDYNVAGLILHFSSPDDQVAIDGRTDRYGAEYVEAYTEMEELRGPWAATLASLDPTAALLRSDEPLAHVLITERGWSVAREDEGWVLLTPPAAIP